MKMFTAPLTRPLLILMRGLPGSGKSSLAKAIVDTYLKSNQPANDSVDAIQDLSISSTTTKSTPRGIILTTDDFFITDAGEYHHDSKLLEFAHRWNQGRAVRAMAIQKIPLVIIDNTNVTKWEMRPYVRAANDHAYDVRIMEPLTEWWTGRDLNVMFEKNTHHVPLFALEKMASRWETVTSVDEILNEENDYGNRNTRHSYSASRGHRGRGSYR